LGGGSVFLERLDGAGFRSSVSGCLRFAGLDLLSSVSGCFRFVGGLALVSAFVVACFVAAASLDFDGLVSLAKSSRCVCAVELLVETIVAIRVVWLLVNASRRQATNVLIEVSRDGADT